MKFFKTLAFAAFAVCMVALIGCSDDEDKIIKSPLAVPSPHFDEDASSGSTLTLRWDAVEDASSYMVKWWKEGNEVGALEESVRSTSYTLTGLESLTTYYAQVMACSADGDDYNSSYSSAVSATTLEEGVEPEPGTETGEATIDITLLHSSSSTLTFEWTVNGSKNAAAALDYNVALYEDEACTNLWVSWIVTKDLYQPASNVWVRFTFSDLDPGKDYWVKINADGDDSVYSEPFKATTKTFDYTVSTNTTAAVGDVLVAEDFKGLIHGGDVAYNAMAIGLYDETDGRARAAMRATYQHSRGENPDDYAIPADHSREFNIVTGGSVTAEYTEGTGLGDWCIGKGTNVSTRPGYAKIGGGSGAIGYLATPELSAIPEGYLATVKVQCDILSYNEDTDKGDYGHQLQISAIENVVVENYQVDGWSTTSDNAVPLVADVLDIESAIGGSNADHDFYAFETTLDGVSNACRIRFCSNPAYYNGGSRFLLDNVVVTVEDIYEDSVLLTAPEDVAFDEDASTTSSLTLTWSAVSGAKSYTVQWWAENDTENVTTVEEITATSLVISDLEPETTYCAKVMAVSRSGEEYNSEYSEEVSATTLGPRTITVELVNASSSTLTFSWEIEDEEGASSAAYDYNVALYKDEACTDLFVSWILASSLFNQYVTLAPRFTFTGLDAGTNYWLKVNVNDDDLVYSEPFAAQTTTFGYTVSANATAAVGDVLVAEDFHGLIHGGDIGFEAPAISTSANANRATYQISTGENPTDYASPVQSGTEFNLFSGGSVSTDYTEATGLGDWCIGNGTNTSTRPGYAKIGGASNWGYLATPELSTIPEGYVAKVKVDFSAMTYSQGSSDYGSDILVAVVDNVVVGSKCQVAAWGLGSSSDPTDSAEFIDYELVSLDSAKGANMKFVDFSVELEGVSNVSRIRFSSNTQIAIDNKTRFLLDNVVVTVEELAVAAEPEPLTAPTAAFDEYASTYTSLKVKWDEVANASSYTVKFYAQGDESNATEEEVEVNYITFSDLTEGATYCAQVKAHHVKGSKYDSEYSDVVSATTKVLGSGVYYEDDFEWVRPYAESFNQQDIVATNEFGTFTSTYAGNVTLDGKTCLEDLHERGYKVLDTSGKDMDYVIPMPGYFLLYCSVSARFAELQLPKLTKYPEASDSVWIDLEWCPSTNGKLVPDTVCLTVEITNGDVTKTFDSEPSTAGTQTLYWSEHVFEVEGVTIDENTKISVRPIDEQWTGESTYRRYLVGGIKIYTPAN